MAQINKGDGLEVTELGRQETSDTGEIDSVKFAPNGNALDRGLQRGLKGRHLQLFAIGSVIGSSIWYGGGIGIQYGGPATLLISFLILGIDLFFVMQSLGELATLFPVYLHGFYAHAGHSYQVRDTMSAAKIFEDELRVTIAAAHMLTAEERKTTPLMLAVGATPTVNAAYPVNLNMFDIPSNCAIELHAGCYAVNDLQQLSTGAITRNDIAIRVMVEVCSVYEDRDEVLVNAGVLALSRETSRGFAGFGQLEDNQDWHVMRMSQEHGILGRNDRALTSSIPLKNLSLGQKVLINVQHACITAAGYEHYFVIDEHSIVCDVWYPWRGCNVIQAAPTLTYPNAEEQQKHASFLT